MIFARALASAVAAPVSIPSPPESEWWLGPFPLRAYALCILAGVAVAVWMTSVRYEKRGGDPDLVLDVTLWAVPMGILGARAYHVITSPDSYFGPHGDLLLIPQIWHGGLGIWGGVMAGAATVIVMLRRRHLPLGTFVDAVAPGLLVAQAIGRLGNWFNQELFGAPTTLPWGLEIDAEHLPAGIPAGTTMHPTFLYELLWNGAGALLLIALGGWLARRHLADLGLLGWSYLMVYTAGRGWIEMLRIDSAQHIAGLRLNVWTSLIVFTVGAVGFVMTWRRARTTIPDSRAVGRVHEEPGIAK